MTAAITREQAVALAAAEPAYAGVDPDAGLIALLPGADEAAYVATAAGAIIWDSTTGTYQLDNGDDKP